MTYQIYYRVEGEPGVGHSLGPREYEDPADTLAEVYDLIRTDQVLSVTVLTGVKMSRPLVAPSQVKLIKRAR